MTIVISLYTQKVSTLVPVKDIQPDARAFRLKLSVDGNVPWLLRSLGVSPESELGTQGDLIDPILGRVGQIAEMTKHIAKLTSLIDRFEMLPESSTYRENSKPQLMQFLGLLLESLAALADCEVDSATGKLRPHQLVSVRWE